MDCNSCGNKAAYRVSYSSGGSSCDRCGNLGTIKFADVYFKEPYFDAHIAHDTKAPFGTQIKSRQHKADVMREYGLKETGDKRHGARR